MCTYILLSTYLSNHPPTQHPVALRAGPSGGTGDMGTNQTKSLPSESLESAGKDTLPIIQNLFSAV